VVLAFRRGFKTEANRIALQVRAQLGLNEIAPIDPAVVCAHFEIQLLKLSEAQPDSPFLQDAHNSAFSAVIVPCGLKKWRSSTTTHITRTVSGAQSATNSPIVFSVISPLRHYYLTANRYRDGTTEEEANFLAGTLLLANEAAVYLVESGLLPQAQRLYGISKSMLT
jgi:hypothetical protein